MEKPKKNVGLKNPKVKGKAPKGELLGRRGERKRK